MRCAQWHQTGPSGPRGRSDGVLREYRNVIIAVPSVESKARRQLFSSSLVRTPEAVRKFRLHLEMDVQTQFLRIRSHIQRCEATAGVSALDEAGAPVVR